MAASVPLRKIAVPALSALIAAAPAALHAQQTPPPAAGERPNIVLILADDLGYGDVGCYGQRQIRTPNLDRMAQEGMRFTSFYAGSTVCAPSRCVLMTGYHAGHAWVRGNGKTDLRAEDLTVAETLKGAGYATSLIGKWGLGSEGSDGLPTRQGFDSFFGYLDHVHAHNYYPTFLVRDERRVSLKNVVPGDRADGAGMATVREEYTHDLFTEEALQYLDKQTKERPFFLYLAYTIPHANNEAKAAGMEVPELGAYADKDWPAGEKGKAAMITQMDRDIGRLMARLKLNGLDEKTLVIFTSDNGPHKEGGVQPEFHDSNGPLRGIKRDLYEGGIRVPMIARWPGKIAAGATSGHQGHFADFLATAAELAGTPVPPSRDGISFVPTLLGQPERQKSHEYLYWEFYEQGGAQAVRRGDWKAVSRPWGAPIQLFDLKADLGEKRDLAASHPDIVAQMKRDMEQAHVPSANWQVVPLKQPAPAARGQAPAP